MCVYAKQWGSFAKPFLPRKSKKYYISRVGVCSLLLSSMQFPCVLLCFHLWPVWFYHTFNINAKTARLSENRAFHNVLQYSSMQWSLPLGMDHCSSEEYRCTHVAACVAITWILCRCVPCHLWCTHRTSLVVKITFSVFLWLWTILLEKSFGFLVINVCNHGQHYESFRKWVFWFSTTVCSKKVAAPGPENRD
jgi:hypothetical protein